MKTCIIQTTKEILGESCGSFVVKNDTTWWNVEAKIIIKEKEKWRNEKNLAKYKEIKTKTKVAIYEAKLKAFKEIFDY